MSGSRSDRGRLKLSPRLTAKEERAFALAEDVLKLANGLVDAAIAVLAIERDRRNAQSYGIALLCRSISNFQGSLTMARENQAVECLTLVRLCFENMLLVVGLCEGGADFVKAMRGDNAANLASLGKLESLNPDAAANSNYEEFVDAQFKRFSAKYEEKPKKLELKHAAKNLMAVYRHYRELSHDPAHASLSALGRHFRPVRERTKTPLKTTIAMIVVPPFKRRERLVVLDTACNALLGVCMGVDLLMGGTAQSEAIGAFSKRFVNETSEPA